MDIEGLLHQTFPPSGNRTHRERLLIYPEELLQQTDGGVRLYACVQQYTRQFVSVDPTVRFADTQMARLLQLKVGTWDDEYEDARTPRVSTPNSLFSWSSSEKYISARKRELKEKLPSPARPETPKLMMGHRVNVAIEAESSRFIQDRILELRAQQALKVDERKPEPEVPLTSHREEQVKKTSKGFLAMFGFESDKKRFLLFGRAKEGKGDVESDETDAEKAEPEEPSDAPKSPKQEVDATKLPNADSLDAQDSEATDAPNTETTLSPKPDVFRTRSPTPSAPTSPDPKSIHAVKPTMDAFTPLTPLTLPK